MYMTYCAVVCFLFILGGLAEEAPLIKPSQLLIGTVIDTTNSEIVRDAVTFLKSVRIFGGSMNDATILVGITGSYDNCSVDNTILPTLTELGVEIVFLTQTVKHAKTLNKFKIFDLFDSTRFDYFLWIDADIVVFDDPLPYLHMHKYPGEIECVPDFYSYMRRFGKINTSSEYWNPNLPTFHLLGEYETAPSGLCNTGLLYFDGLSLGAFREGLHKILHNQSYLALHGQDRFVDSLIFTQVVHEAALQVSVLPTSLNFMALFEIEIQDEMHVTDIVMAHLVSDTELYCIRTAPSEPDQQAPGCSCVYRNKLISPKGSLLKSTIEDKILSSPEICLMFAGASLLNLPANVRHKSAPSVLAHNEFELMEGSTATEMRRCELLSPPGTDWVLRSPAPAQPIQLEVVLRCDVSRSYLNVHKYIDVANSITSTADSLELYRSAVSAATHRVQCRAESCALQIHYTVEFSIPAEGADFLHPASQVSLSITVGESANALRIRSTFSVVHENLLSPGQVHYSTNLLLSAKSVALESQLLLPEYLNSRQAKGTGVATCCDTHKGIATVKRLIQHWRGDYLLIVLERAPASVIAGEGEGSCRAESQMEVEKLLLAEQLRGYCNTRMLADSPNHNFLCFVSVPPPLPPSFMSVRTTWSRQVASALRPDSVQFVYSDVVHEYAQQAALLSQWVTVLAKGGLLICTQHMSLLSAEIDDWNTPQAGAGPSRRAVHHEQHAVVDAAPAVEGCSSASSSTSRTRRMHSARAVDAVMLKLAQSALLTHSERDPRFCAAFARGVSTVFSAEAAEGECAPAWFVFKQRTSR